MKQNPSLKRPALTRISGELLDLRASLARLAGRLDLAQQLDEKAIVELKISNALQPLTLVHAALSSILTARGDLQSAEKQLSEVSASVSPEVQGTVELARAELSIRQGPISASRRSGPAIRRCISTMRTRTKTPRWR